jgi:hypothetical protein
MADSIASSAVNEAFLGAAAAGATAAVGPPRNPAAGGRDVARHVRRLGGDSERRVGRGADGVGAADGAAQERVGVVPLPQSRRRLHVLLERQALALPQARVGRWRATPENEGGPKCERAPAPATTLQEKNQLA